MMTSYCCIRATVDPILIVRFRNNFILDFFFPSADDVLRLYQQATTAGDGGRSTAPRRRAGPRGALASIENRQIVCTEARGGRKCTDPEHRPYTKRGAPPARPRYTKEGRAHRRSLLRYFHPARCKYRRTVRGLLSSNTAAALMHSPWGTNILPHS